MSEEDAEEIEIVLFFLDKDNETIYTLFRTLSLFLLDYYAIDSTIMIELVKEQKLPIQETITHIAYIHNSYSKLLLDSRKATNDSSN